MTLVIFNKFFITSTYSVPLYKKSIKKVNNIQKLIDASVGYTWNINAAP